MGSNSFGVVHSDSLSISSLSILPSPGAIAGFGDKNADPERL